MPHGAAARIAFALAAAVIVTVAGFSQPRNLGDGDEYALSLEALASTGRPAISAATLTSLATLDATAPSAAFLPSDEHAKLLGGMQASSTVVGGMHRALSGEYYGHHFWFYSLLAVPAKLLLRALGQQELKAFQTLNAVLLCATLYYLLFLARISSLRRVSAAFALAGSGVLFYVVWPHPEVYDVCLVSLACVLALEAKYVPAVTASALASLQAPPAAFLVAPIMALQLSRASRSARWRVVLTAIPGLIALVPYLFSLRTFGVPNVLAALGYADPRNITLGRIASLFLDPNQGVVVGVPWVIAGSAVAVPCLVRRSLALAGRLPLSRVVRIAVRTQHVWLLMATALMALGVVPQIQWNSGHSVFQRYGLWVAMPLSLWVAWLVAALPRASARRLLLAAATLQTAVFVHFNGFAPVHDPLELKPLAAAALECCPGWYQPDATIFLTRVLGGERLHKLASPVVFGTADKATQIAVFDDDAVRLDEAVCGAGAELWDVERRKRPSRLRFDANGWALLSGSFVCRSARGWRADRLPPLVHRHWFEGAASARIDASTASLCLGDDCYRLAAARGVIESTVALPDEHLVRGWAAQRTPFALPDRLLAIHRGRVVRSVAATVARPDLARTFAEPRMIAAGFRMVLERNTLVRGVGENRLEQIRFFAAYADRTAVELVSGLHPGAD